MKGLVVTRLKVADLGPLRGVVDVGELDPALTLITGDNETGKSTLVQGMRAALFENHAAGHQGLKDLQTHGTRLAPQVWVEFAVGDVAYTLHKRFLTKPAALLTEGGSGDSWEGPEAEARLQELLDSNPAGRQGARAEHMGVWGLLWVTQDEAAFSDPGKELPPEIKGQLQEAIGRQVATVLGGRDGEKLRTAIGERFARYFTPTGRETGELASHRQEAATALARVTEIEAAVALVEEWAGQRESDSSQLKALCRDQDDRQAKLDGARTATSKAKTLQAEARAASEVALARTAAAEQAEEALARRQGLLAEVVDAAEQVSKSADAHTELDAQLAALQLAADARTRQRLSQAEDVSADLAKAGGGLGEETLGRLRALHAELQARLAELEAVGTRLTVTSEDSTQSWTVGRQRTLTVTGIGEVAVTPSREGLADAVEAAREGRSLLAASLHSAGGEDLDAVRALRRERVRAEVELDRLTARLAELAPDGVAALAEAVGELRAATKAALAAAEQAAKLGKRRDKLTGSLAANPATPEAAERLWELDRQATVSRSTADAIAPTVEVSALADFALTVDDADATSLSTGDQTRIRATAATSLRIGDVARVSVVPGGEDLTRVAAEAAAFEAERAAALEQLGAATADEAKALARAWREDRAALDDLGDRLRELDEAATAPQRDLAAEERRLAEAEGLAKQAEGVRRSLEDQPVTEQALGRVEDLARALAGHDAVVAERAARVDGPGGLAGVVAGVRRSEQLKDGGTWELVPGEGGAPADIAWARAHEELESALADAQVPSLEEAERAGRRAEERRHLQARLQDLAPDGLPALQEDVAALSEGDPGDGLEPTPDAEQLAAVFGARVQAHDDGHKALEGRHEALDKSLRDARGQAQDDALRDERSRARTAAQVAAEAAGRANAALEASSAELLEDDLARAEGALAAAREQEDELRRRITELDTRLADAAAEGHFEELGEAQAVSAAAQDRLARTAADAEATRMLQEAVEARYAESQRRFLAPVVREATPYLQLIRPGSSLKMSPDLTVASVVRKGAADPDGEAWDRLSGGTREQLSVIVRLALARVLARDQRPLPLILDDTLGWTDDRRLEHMARILRNASKELQIIVLTCHPSRFHGLGQIRTIPLDELARKAREQIEEADSA